MKQTKHYSLKIDKLNTVSNEYRTSYQRYIDECLFTDYFWT